MKITLHGNLDIQNTYEGWIVWYSSRWTIVTQLHYWTVNRKCALYRQERVQTIALYLSVGQYLTWHQSYCASFSYTPKIPVVFNNNAKNAKNEDFWINSIISTAVNFNVLWCFLVCYIVFSWHAMKLDSNRVFSNVRHCFCVFCIIHQKIRISWVMTNKMVWNESMSRFKHVHIIQGKIW